MPVRKYRSVEEMPGVPPRAPHDPENLAIACELSELAAKLYPRKLEPGVWKFRTMEEANRHRRRQEKERCRGS